MDYNWLVFNELFYYFLCSASVWNNGSLKSITPRPTKKKFLLESWLWFVSLFFCSKGYNLGNKAPVCNFIYAPKYQIMYLTGILAIINLTKIPALFHSPQSLRLATVGCFWAVRSASPMVSRPRNWIAEYAPVNFPFSLFQDHQAIIAGTYMKNLFYCMDCDCFLGKPLIGTNGDPSWTCELRNRWFWVLGFILCYFFYYHQAQNTLAKNSKGGKGVRSIARGT